MSFHERKMDANADKLDPDQLFKALKESSEAAGFAFLDRTMFDEIFEFNELCQILVGQSDNDYEFPFIYLTGKLFSRLTPAARITFLAEFEKELSEWR